MAKHKQSSLTAAEAAQIAATVDAEQAKTESEALPQVPCCGRCLYFRISSKTTGLGACHANPPQVTAHNDINSTTAWPQVDMEKDWCGKYKEK